MKVLVTGSTGLCGSSIRENSKNHEYYYVNSKDCDLRSPDDVKKMFLKYNPDYVIHTAARVGGILANMKYPETFLYDNIMMNANVIRECVNFNVKKLFAFSSVCVFPDDLSLLEEEKINNGPVFEANFAYGYAKRIVDTHIKAAKKQYGVKNWCSIIPGNIFGKNDLFSIENGHIIPAVMHKMYLAKKNNSALKLLGDGYSLREFIFVDDLAKIIISLLDKDDIPDKIIVSGREEISIRDVVSMMADVADFKNEIIWDSNTPNGQRSRPSSKKRVDSIFPDFKYTDIKNGLSITWEWFCKNYPNIRS